MADDIKLDFNAGFTALKADLAQYSPDAKLMLRLGPVDSQGIPPREYPVLAGDLQKALGIVLPTPAPAERDLYVVSRVGLRVRTSPGGTVVAALPYGAPVTVGEISTVGSITWVRLVSDPYPGKWIAEKEGTFLYLSSTNPIPPATTTPTTPTPAPGSAPVVTPTPAPTPAPTPPLFPKATVGIHVAGSGDLGDFVGVVDRCAKNGTPVPAMVIINDSSLVSTAKRLSPGTICVYRGGISGGDLTPFNEQGQGDGAAWFDRWYPYHKGVPADYYQMYNEVSFSANMKDLRIINGAPRYLTQAEKLAYANNVASVEIAMMKRATAAGVRLAIGNYMPGVPEPETFGDALAPVWDYAETNGHAALMHWYSGPGGSNMYHIKEYKLERFIDYWARWPKLVIIIGEMGLYDSPRFRGIDSMRQTWIDAYDITKRYRDRGQKIVIMSWTIRGQYDANWKLDDWTSYLGEYERVLKSGRI